MKMFLPVVLVLCLNIFSAFADTVNVTNSNDSGPGSLRAAIASAASGDFIEFTLPLPNTITLTSGELLIDKDLTINGPFPFLTIARSSAAGTPHFAVFHIAAGPFTVGLIGLTISNGYNDGVTSSGRGGGLDNESTATVAISECNFSNNQAYYSGGGIGHNYGTGELDLTDCVISQNTVIGTYGGGLATDTGGGTVNLLHCIVSANISNFYAGGIYNGSGGTMTITESTISDNVLTVDPFGGAGDGAGISNDGTLTVDRSTIAYNTNGRGNGGGINNQGILTVTNSTFFDNTAAQDGGAIESVGSTTLTNCTITANTASQQFASGQTRNGGGGVANFGNFFSTPTLKNTIVAGNDSPTNPDVAGEIVSNGYNLIGDGTGGTIIPMAGDQIGTSDAPIDPLLGPLEDNGGPTETCALLAGSPALDAGGAVEGVTGDQRNLSRPVDDPLLDPAPGEDNSDIGAFESQLAHAANISTRDNVLTGDNILDGGFIIQGQADKTKTVLIRAIGPSLSEVLNGVLPDPTLSLYGQDPTTPLATNDNWRDTQESEIEATGLAPVNDLEAAVLATLVPGAYTAIVSGKDGGTGIGLVEIYDLDQVPDFGALGNVSTRGLVGTGDDVLIGGLILGPNGGAARNVLIRGIGPSLVAAGLSEALQDPEVELYDSNAMSLAFNDNWRDSQEAEIEATGLAPADDKEAAIFATLPSGPFTAIVRGVGMTTGVALVEVYSVP
jgi:predicted outer membrane repeat protein